MRFSLRLILLLLMLSGAGNLTAGEITVQENSLQAKLNQAEKIAQTNYDSAFLLLEPIIKISLEKKQNHELAQAYKLAGFCQYFKSNYPSALEYYQKAEKIA